MIHAIKRSWILGAAVAAVTLIGASATQAQFRVQTGQSNDANNRIGSGGFNDGATSSHTGLGIYNGATGNDIVTGNITGGKQFRGRIDYTDAGAFRGALSSRASDAFVRESSGVPTSYGGASNSNAQTVRPFYGDARGVAPPAGFQQANIGTSGYVPGPDNDQRLGSDLRLGDTSTLPTVILPQPGQTMLPGPLDSSAGNQTLIMASSLYGVRPFNSGNQADQQFVQRYANAFGAQQTNSLSDAELNAARGELLQAAPMGQSATVTNPNGQQQSPQQPGTDQNLSQPLGAPAGSPNNAALPTNQLQSALPSGQALTSGIATGESVQSRVMLPAAQQTAANATLAKQLAENSGGAQQPMSDVQAAQQYNRDMLAAKKAADAKNNPTLTPQPANPNSATPSGATPNGATPNAQTPQTPGGAAPSAPSAASGSGAQKQKSPPPKIESLYAGVKAKGLGDLLKDGEDQMKQGKWYDAIQKYDTAQQVAPNNMLILVGRANAELGASSYGPAEADLRTAFTQDPAMMEGQFDLRKMIGDDRLQFLVTDLKEIQQKNPTQARPVFLLAYINYNTGNERLAAGYLDLAEKRAGGGDTFFSMVRGHWALPASEASPTTKPALNK